MTVLGLIIYKNTMFFGKCIVMIIFFDKFAAGIEKYNCVLHRLLIECVSLMTNSVRCYS